MLNFATLSFFISRFMLTACQSCIYSNQCSSGKSCSFVRETTRCVSEIARISGDFEDNFENYPICDQNYVKTDVRSFVVRPPELSDFVKINVTFEDIDFRVRALAFRQKCSSKNTASSSSDPLCSNHSRPQWDRFHWPCRIFRFEDFMHNTFGTLFYPCLHAGIESNLMHIHVLLYPQACQLVYDYRVPQMTYGSFEFSPFLVADTNSRNGNLILHYQFLGHFDWMAKERVEIVAEIDGKLASRRTVLKNSDLASFFFFTNLSNGRHVAVVRLSTEHCPDYECPPNFIPFDIWTSGSELKNIPDEEGSVFTTSIFFCSFIILLVLCIIASVAAFHYGSKLYKVRRKINRRNGIHHINFYD